MKILLASDHGGFNLKAVIKDFLVKEGVEVVDFGPTSKAQDDDYPDYVVPAIMKLQEDPVNQAAIVLCRNGVGVSMTANKFKGVRAALCLSPKQAISSKTDDNSNVLALASDYLDEKSALEIVQVWLSAEFSNETRHIRRLGKIKDLGM